MPAITSAANARVREWRKLRRPEVARSQSLVFVEGAHAVLQALGSPHYVEALLLCPALANAGIVQGVLARAGTSVPVYELSDEAFASLSGRDGPSGVAAVIELRVGALAEVVPAPDDIVLALWRVENPGNLGTIVRSADAFRARAVVLVDRCCNPYAPETARASMGAIFHTPLVACRDLGELRAWCDRHGVTLAGTSARGAVPAGTWGPRLPLALLFGREGGGLTEEGKALCDHTVCIPMEGVNTSLNLATAAGILACLAALARGR